MFTRKMLGAVLLPATILGGCALDLESTGAPIGINWDCQTGPPADQAACRQDPARRFPGQKAFESAPAWHRFFPMNARSATLESAASGGDRVIEEGDIVKRSEDDSTMYVLNPFRGLLILDISNPDQPQLRGRLRIQGNPSEMYVRDGVAFVLMNDYYEWRNEAPKFGAQVLAIDVSNTSSPVLLGSTDVRGSMTDSRIVGDVLYVVSSYYGETGETNFTSIDVRNPQVMTLVDEKTIQGNGWLIHVADAESCSANAPCYIFVTKNDWATQTTEVQAVSIRDAAGHMAVGAEVEVQGQVQNRFHMSYDGTHLRVVSHDWNWQATGADRGTIYVQAFNTREAMISQGALALESVGSLDAARFSGDYAYLSHTVQVDPLDVIDLSNPDDAGSWQGNDRLESRIDIPGRLQRIEVRGNRLLAIGSENGQNQVEPRECAGYQWTAWQPTQQWGQTLAAAIYDVSDPAAACEVARVRFGDDSWAWSNAFWDDKALRFLSDDKLLLMPFQQNADSVVQLIDVDLECDPNEDCAALQVRGQVRNDMQVDRSFMLGGDRLAALSSKELVVADIADRAAPRVTAELELARNVMDFERVGNKYGLQLVGEYDQVSELRVVRIADPDGMGGAVVGRVSTGRKGGARMFVNGAVATLISQEYISGRWEEVNGEWRQLEPDRTDAYVTNFRINQNNGSIRKLGELYLPGYNPDLSTPLAEARRWGGLDSVVRVQRGNRDFFVIASTTETGGRYCVVSNANPEAPALKYETTGDAQRVPVNTTIEDLKVFGSTLYVVSYYTVPTNDVGLPEAQPLQDQSKAAAASQAATPANTSILPPVWRSERQRVLYHVTPITLSAQGLPSFGPNISVPGRLVDVAPTGNYMTFLDNRWVDMPALPPICMAAAIDCSAPDLDPELALCCNPVPFEMTDQQEKAIFTATVQNGIATLVDGITVDAGTENVMVRGRQGDARSSAYYTVANWGWRGPIGPVFATAEAGVEVEAPQAMSIMPPRMSKFELVILDFQDFAQIREASRIDFSTGFGSGANLLDARDVQLNGHWTRMLFTTLGSGALAVYDVEDRANPRLAVLDRTQGWFSRLVIDGRSAKAYAASGYAGVLAFDLAQQQ